MFTGIVEELGRVIRPGTIEDNVRLTAGAPTVTQGASLGNSVSVSGCYLAVTAVHGNTFTADLIAETLVCTTLGSQAPGDPVSLERALRVGDRSGGHTIQGHVDITAEVFDRHRSGHWNLLCIGLPQGIVRYVVIKESVALDDVSLTVVDVVGASGVTPVLGVGASSGIGLIPETL